MMGHDFFVCHSTRDKLFVDALVHSLEQQSYRCWYAPRDIAAGVSWPAAIAEAIRETPVMLLVFSGSSNISEEISRELTLAANNRCIVIPVRIENVTPSPALEYHLSNRHWLDVYNLETGEAIRRILEGIERYLNMLKTRRDCAVPGTERPWEAGKWPGNRYRPTGALAAALILLLVIMGGAAGYVYFREPPPAPDPYAHLLKPVQNSGLYLYRTVGGDAVTAYLLKLAPFAAETGQPQPYLVALKGIGGRYDGRVFRCRMHMDRHMRFLALIDGREQLLLSVDPQTRAIAVNPESKAEYRLAGIKRDDSQESILNLIKAYQDGKTWPVPD